MSEDKKQEPKEYKYQHFSGVIDVFHKEDTKGLNEEDLKGLREHPVIQTPSSSASAEIIEGIIANHSSKSSSSEEMAATYGSVDTSVLGSHELKDIDVLPPQDVLDQMKAIHASKEGSTEDTQVSTPPVVNPEA